MDGRSRAGSTPEPPGPAAVEVLVLGSCTVRVRRSGAGSPDGDRIDLVVPSGIQRRILCRLAMSRPGSVSVDELAEAVWGDEQPATARTAVHNQVSRIRRRMGAATVRTSAGRYELAVETDLDEVQRALNEVERLLGDGDVPSALRRADAALGLWRGPAFADLREFDGFVSRRRHVDEVQRSLETMRLEASIQEGRSAWAVAEAERLVATTPHDEHRWVLLMRAMEIAGRRGDALGAFERSRRTLLDDLGLSPGSELRATESAILQPEAERVPGGPTRLVGRESIAEAALDRLNTQRTLVLNGESGVGKTRLLAELAKRLRRRGELVALVSCSLHSDTAISTLVELTQELGVILDGTLPPAVDFSTALVPLTLEGRRVVLCVDDLDRAGPTSVGALLAASTVDGVLVVATATEPELLPVEMMPSLLAVPELDPAGLAELVSDRLMDADPDPALVTWLTRMSGGNPLLVEYLLDDVAHWRTAAAEDGAGGPDPSPALRDVVRRRLDRVGIPTRSTLEVASVCGHTFPIELLVDLAPEHGIAGAVAAGLLYEDVDDDATACLSFRHEAVRRILYDDTSPGRRMEIHHRAAAVLRLLHAPVASIAMHAMAAAELDPVAGARWAVDAARAATALGAHAEAAVWYERAVVAAAAAQDADRLRVTALVGRGDALRLAGSSDQEAALFEAADAALDLGAPELVGDAAFAVLQLGATTESGSLHGRAIELADRALAIVTDPDQRALIAAAASLTHSMTGASDMCRELFLQAEATAASAAARRHVLPFAYLGIGHPADLELRERLTDELLRLGAEVDDPVALFEGHQLAFSVGIQRADGPQVRASLGELTDLVERVGDVGRRWALLYQQAAVAHLDNDLGRSEELAEQALELFSAVSPSRAFATYGGQILPIRMAQGRLDELIDTLDGLVADQPGVPAWNAALSLAVAAHEPARAVRLAEAAMEGVPEDFTWLASHVIGGRASAITGDRRMCLRYIERLRPWSGLVCWQGTCSYGPVDTALARLTAALGEDEEAAAYEAAAAEQARSLRAPVFAVEVGSAPEPSDLA